MNSQESPRSTSARTSATKTRVPLKVGLPWQMAGSATIYRPNSILGAVRFFAVVMARIYPALNRLTKSGSAAKQQLFGCPSDDANPRGLISSGNTLCGRTGHDGDQYGQCCLPDGEEIKPPPPPDRRLARCCNPSCRPRDS